MARETKAQILVFPADAANVPVAFINRNNNGHPTGADGTTQKLVDIVTNRVERLGVYDAEHLTAGLIYELIDKGTYPYEYGVTNRINQNARFIYAIRPSGVAVYDARNIEDLADLAAATPMFETAWVEPAKVNAANERITALEEQLKKAKLDLESLKRKQFRVR